MTDVPKTDTCEVCHQPLDNLSPGVMVVERSAPGGVYHGAVVPVQITRLVVCGHCLPAMVYNGWTEIARAK